MECRYLTSACFFYFEKNVKTFWFPLFIYCYKIVILLFRGVRTVKKLTVSALSMFMLFAFLLGNGIHPAEKIKALDPKSKMILPGDHVDENLPGPDTDDKKNTFISHTLLLITLVSLFLIKDYPSNAFSALFAFLTAVFFQSNCVIKPL
jgi:hypothetical protein